MTPTPIARPISTGELVKEIYETLIEVRARRQTGAEPRREWHRREAEVALDATVALLIRHRLKINADRATRAVKTAQCEDLDVFARGCAQHVLDIAGEQHLAPDAHLHDPGNSERPARPHLNNEDITMAQTFTAKYRSRCGSGCDRDIEPGDDIIRVDQEIVHDECALGSGAPPRSAQRDVCLSCFTEVFISGDCLC